MLIRVVRDLSPEEVFNRIREFENEFGLSFERFEQLLLKEKTGGRLWRVYFEWIELVDSYRGYVDDGQLDHSIEEIIDIESSQASMLTPKRIQLLYQLGASRVESINDLAKKVRRDVKNVYEDLQILRRFGFVKLSKGKGRALVPETTIKEISFLVR